MFSFSFEREELKAERSLVVFAPLPFYRIDLSNFQICFFRFASDEATERKFSLLLSSLFFFFFIFSRRKMKKKSGILTSHTENQHFFTFAVSREKKFQNENRRKKKEEREREREREREKERERDRRSGSFTKRHGRRREIEEEEERTDRSE